MSPKKEKDKIATKQLRTDMNMVFGSEQGKRVLKYLSEYSNVFTQPSTREEFLDTNAMMIMNGQRDVILEIFRLMNITDEEINNLLQE